MYLDKPYIFRYYNLLLGSPADFEISLLNIYGSKYMIRMPGNGVEQFHFRAIFNDFFYPLLFNAPVFGNIKKLVVRETDITTFNPVYLVLDILVHCIPFAAVPLLQAFYFDVLKAVSVRLII